MVPPSYLWPALSGHHSFIVVTIFGFLYITCNSLFRTFAVFWMQYAFLWVIPRRMNCIRRFETLCLLHLHRWVGMKMERSVPKRWRIKFIRRGITQKKAYSIIVSYSLTIFVIYWAMYPSQCRSQWPRGLRRGSTAPRLLRLWVRIPPAYNRCTCVKRECTGQVKLNCRW